MMKIETVEIIQLKNVVGHMNFEMVLKEFEKSKKRVERRSQKIDRIRRVWVDSPFVAMRNLCNGCFFSVFTESVLEDIDHD